MSLIEIVIMSLLFDQPEIMPLKSYLIDMICPF